MATATPVDTTGNMRTWNITGVLSGDNSVTITHGMSPQNPEDLRVFFEPRDVSAGAASWAVAIKTSESIGLVKATGAGTNPASPGAIQVTVIVWDPHSIVQ
jgi:hypothetical protein